MTRASAYALFVSGVADWFEAEPHQQRTARRPKCRRADTFGCPLAYTRTRMRERVVRIEVNRQQTPPYALEPRWF